MNSQRAFEKLERNLQEYISWRKSAIERGAETPELAALLLREYGSGLAQAAKTCFDLDDVQTAYEGELNYGRLMSLMDVLVADIDPSWQETRSKIWEARPAGLIFNAMPMDFSKGGTKIG